MCSAGHLQSMATPGPSAEEVDRKLESTQKTMKFDRTIINIHSSFIRARPGDFQEGHREEGFVLALESSQHSPMVGGKHRHTPQPQRHRSTYKIRVRGGMTDQFPS